MLSPHRQHTTKRHITCHASSIDSALTHDVTLFTSSWSAEVENRSAAPDMVTVPYAVTGLAGGSAGAGGMLSCLRYFMKTAYPTGTHNKSSKQPPAKPSVIVMGKHVLTTHAHTHTHIHTYAHIHPYIHAYIHTHAYTHTYIQTHIHI